jgi:uncharacterized membrane protein
MARKSTFARFAFNEAGNFAMLTALTAPFVVILGAFAVDVGANFVEKRQAQSMTDLAAIAAASNPERAHALALQTFADNGFSRIRLASSGRDDGPNDQQQTLPVSFAGRQGTLTVTTGRYAPDPARTTEQRFEAHASPPNAVEVIFQGTGSRYFAGAFADPPKIGTRALAATEAVAAFSVGSRLAALEAGIANAILGGLLGSNISLSVMDYEALIGADLSLLGFLEALSLEAGLRVATYEEVLDAEVTMGQVARAAQASGGQSGPVRGALSRLAGGLGRDGGGKLRLSRLIDLGPAGSTLLDAGIDQLGLDIGVMELLMSSAMIAGKGKQVSLDLGAQVPGLLDVRLDLSIGEPPQHGTWFSVGQKGQIVRTAQTRLGLVAQIGGLGGLLGPTIRIPLYLELAFAEAQIADIACTASGTPRVSVNVRSGVADLHLGEVERTRFHDHARAPSVGKATLVSMPLVSVRARANARIANPQAQTLTFDAADIAADRVKQVSTRGMTTSLTRSLLSDLSLEVNVVGLGLGLPSGLTSLLGTTIAAATPALDAVIDGVLRTLGVSVGQADVRVHRAECTRPVLVQ